MRSERLIRALIRLYPADFRARYARAMLAFHRERMSEGRNAWHCVVFDHSHGRRGRASA